MALLHFPSKKPELIVLDPGIAKSEWFSSFSMMTQAYSRRHALRNAATFDPVVFRKPISALIALILLVFVGLAAINIDRPPQPSPASIPAGQFSAERALRHVSVIGNAPHPVGTPQHDAVRDYILSVLAEEGIHAEVQRSTAVSQYQAVAGNIENIIARLPGTEGGVPLLLVAHYDSMPTSFGASDDGAGVATLLECARALKSLPQKKREIIFLFTDAEEVGLLGAEAFVADGRQMAKKGIVLNFDSRGTSGPAILFETSNGNSSLIRAFRQSAKNPVANSLFYEVYKRLPNNTDFSVFKKSGYPGLNFAFIEGLVRYHTAEDNVSNLDPATLQQEGDDALGLANWLGDTAPLNLQKSNTIYFDVLGLELISYSFGLEIALTILAGALLLVLTLQVYRKGWVSGKAVLFGILAIALALVAAFAGSFVADRLMEPVAGIAPSILAGELYTSGLYVTAISIFGLAAASTVFAWGTSRIGSTNLGLAGLFVWFGVLSLSSIFMPGAGSVWLWPLLFVLSGWNIVAVGNVEHGGVLLTAALAPGVLLLAPLVYKIFTAFMIGSYPIVSLVLTLFMALLVCPLAPTRQSRPWIVPAGLVLSGIVVSVAALLLSPRFDPKHPRLDSTFYAENLNSGSALWASYDGLRDPWNSQFFPARARRETLDQFLPGNQRKLLQAMAQPVPLAAPMVQMLETKSIDGGREIHLHLISARHAPVLSLSVANDSVLKAWVNGKEISGEHSLQGIWSLQYYALPPEGIDLVLDLKGISGVNLRVADISYGLPEGAMGGLHARPENVIFSPMFLSDTTIALKSFDL
jgi:hypothetical protein